MKTHYLLPNKYKLLGWILFTVGLFCGLLMYIFGIDDQLMVTKVFSIYSDPFMGEAGFFKIIENGISDELVSITIIIGNMDHGESLLDVLSNFGVYVIWVFWGIGIFFHALGVLNTNPILGKKWEEQKLKQYMEEDWEQSRKLMQ